MACQAPPSMGFFKQEYWNEEYWLPFPPQWDLPDLGIRPMSPASAGGFFTTGSPVKPIVLYITALILIYLITRRLCLLAAFIQFLLPPPPASGNLIFLFVSLFVCF